MHVPSTWLLSADVASVAVAVGCWIAAGRADGGGGWLALAGVASFLALAPLLDCLIPAGSVDAGRAKRELRPHQSPIVYDARYNITAGGIERIHPFDSRKYGRVAEDLVRRGVVVGANGFVRPTPLSLAELRGHHSRAHLAALYFSVYISRVVEVPVLFLPAVLLRWRLLNPMLLQSGGTLDAVALAARHGWAINLGGGFHHASAGHGEGFCVYADISMAVKLLRRYAGPRAASTARHPGRGRSFPSLAQRVMIVDLDAHQGNGHERDFANDPRVVIVDAYNPRIYPGDLPARRAIAVDVPLTPRMSAAQHLAAYRERVVPAIVAHRASFVIYNAGSDTLFGDPLGGLQLTPDALVERDEMVFQAARAAGVPIVMVLSGGYQLSTAAVIARSIANLHAKGLLAVGDAAGGSSTPPARE